MLLGVLVPQLAVDQVLSGSELGLSVGISDLAVLEIGGRTVLYALGRSDNAVAEVTVNADGTLTPVGTLALTGYFTVGIAPKLGIYEDADGFSLTLAGMLASAGGMVDLDATGGLVGQSLFAGGVELIAPVAVSFLGSSALFSGRVGGGVDLYLDSGAQLTLQSSFLDQTWAYLGDVSASASFVIDDDAWTTPQKFVVTTSATENGLSVFWVQNDGSFYPWGNYGSEEGLPVSGPSGVEVVQRFGETLLVIGSTGSASLTVLGVNSYAQPWLIDHVLDDADTRFDDIAVVDTLIVGDFVYVAAGGSDGGVSLFTMLPGGRLVHLSTIADEVTTTLWPLSSLEMFASDNALHLYGGVEFEAGLTRLSYDLSDLGSVIIGDGGGLSGSALSDQMIGSDFDDVITAGAGDDIVLDGAGSDYLTGGTGADLFVFAQDGVEDWVADFELGTDKLDLSAFDLLTDVSQLTVTATATGAQLSYGDEVIHLTTSNSAPLSALDLTIADILNVDRPMVAPLIGPVFGSAGADSIEGGLGRDTIDGAAGNDTIRGYVDEDLLFGGDGDDFVEAGGQNDTVFGGAGDDLLTGDPGNDLLFGGSGADIIFGDNYFA